MKTAFPPSVQPPHVELLRLRGAMDEGWAPIRQHFEALVPWPRLGPQLHLLVASAQRSPNQAPGVLHMRLFRTPLPFWFDHHMKANSSNSKPVRMKPGLLLGPLGISPWKAAICHGWHQIARDCWWLPPSTTYSQPQVIIDHLLTLD